MQLSDQTFADIQRSLESCDYSGNGTKWQLGAHGVNLDYINTPDYYGVMRLVGIWRANNQRAFHARYYENHDDVRNERTKSWKITGHHYNGEIMEPIQLLKSLQCLSYNLDDHDQCNILKRVIEAVTGLVVTELPEYAAAEWG